MHDGCPIKQASYHGQTQLRRDTCEFTQSTFYSLLISIVSVWNFRSADDWNTYIVCHNLLQIQT